MAVLLICAWLICGFVTWLIIAAIDDSITVGDVFVAIGLSPFGLLPMLALGIPALLAWGNGKTLWRRK